MKAIALPISVVYFLLISSLVIGQNKLVETLDGRSATIQESSSQQTSQVVSSCAAAASVCTNATPIYCTTVSGTLPPSSGSTFFPGCPTSAIDNPVWYLINVESTAMYTIVINPSNCEGGAGGPLGIQGGLYADCGTNAPTLGLQCFCSPGPITFSANLSPGVYYLLVDGCEGNICDFIIDISPDPLLIPLELPSTPIASETSVCPGELVFLSTDIVLGAEEYIWYLPNDVVILDSPPYCNTIEVIWGNTSGTVAVQAVNSCDASPISLPVSLNVEVLESTIFGEYCFPDELGWFNPADGITYPAGLFTLLFITPAGCDSVVNLIVELKEASVAFDSRTICEGDSLTYPWGGTYFATFDTTIILDNANAVGCDSTINYTLLVIDPDLSISYIGDSLTCDTFSGGVLAVDYSGMANYNWETADGQINSNPNSSSIEIDERGTYQVEVELLDFDGTVLCVRSSEFTIPSVFPGIEVINSQAACNGNDGVAYVEISPPSNSDFTFLWSDPLSQTTDTATNLAPGTYEVTISDEEACEQVETIVVEGPIDFIVATTLADCANQNGIAEILISNATGSYLFEWSNGLEGPVQTGLEVGVYLVSITDQTTGCNTIAGVKIEGDPNCQVLIGGYVYDDREEPDCVQDAHTLPIANLSVKAENGSEVYTAFTDATGYYEFDIPTGIYTIKVANPRGDYVRLCTDACAVDASIPAQTYAACDFYYQFIEKPDLSLVVFKEPIFVGQSFNYELSAANIGNIPFDAQLTVFYDPDLAFLSANLEPNDQDGNALIWDLPNFSPGDEQSITLTFQLGFGPLEDDQIDFFFSLTPMDEDLSPENNEFSCTATIQDQPLLPFPPSASQEQTVLSTLAPTHLYPNPSNGRLVLEWQRPLKPLEVRLLDGQGRIVEELR
ncbi:MAG: SdrD B-like domain-containing protein, partial [Bacteroidota bacterium]